MRGCSPKISIAATVGTSTPSFMKVEGSTTPERVMFHFSSTKPARYSAPFTSPTPTVRPMPVVSAGMDTPPA